MSKGYETALSASSQFVLTKPTIVLIKVAVAAHSGASTQDDGTIPDVSADLKALQKFLELNDVSTDPVDQKDDEDD